MPIAPFFVARPNCPLRQLSNILPSSSIPQFLPSHTTLLYLPPHPNIRPNNRLMILRIRRRLIQHTHRLLIQLHKIPLEPQIANPRDILLAVTPIVLEEQRQAARRVEVRALDGDFLDLGGLADGQGLGRGFVRRGLEVEVVGVEEEF